MKHGRIDNDLWAYSKVAFLLDVEEVIWPMVALVRARNITSPTELVKVVTSGQVFSWPRATKRGLKQLVRTVHIHCGVSADKALALCKEYGLQRWGKTGISPGLAERRRNEPSLFPYDKDYYGK